MLEWHIATLGDRKFPNLPSIVTLTHQDMDLYKLELRLGCRRPLILATLTGRVDEVLRTVRSIDWSNFDIGPYYFYSRMVH